MVTALRVHVSHWLAEPALDRLFAWLAKSPGTIEELAFFTSETHPPLPLPVMRERAGRLETVLAQARAQGYAAGINLLATMGHHEENLPGSLDEPWPRLVDPHGRECRGSYCPQGPDFLGYVRAVCRALAEAEPDFLWIDDDVRLAGHAPISATCFCDRCLERFASELGRPVTRAELAEMVERLPAGPLLALRRAWLEHNRALLDRLFVVIEQDVHAARPGLPLGFMTGDRFYEGYAFARWAQTLAGPGQVPVRWRPGGGFYDDSTPLGLVAKAHDVGRQASALPESVRVVQYELENFPYHRLRKAAATVALESAAAMAAGCTGVAFNMLAMDALGLAETTPNLEQVAACRLFLDRLHRELGRSQALGVWPAWSADTWAAGAEVGPPYALAELGLPICYDRAGASVTALSGRMPLAFARSELEEILHGGVLMDVPALQALWELGLGELAGVRLGAVYPVDALETFTADPANGEHAGRLRDCRQSFWPQPAVALEPVSPGVSVLCRLADYRGQDHGPCLTAFENARGGRVAVAGYYPWHMITNGPKVHQYRALARWLARGRLPAVVQSLAKVPLWVREGECGRRAVVLINASLDPQPGLELALLGASSEVEHVIMGGGSQLLQGRPLPGGYRALTIPEVAPWSAHLLLYRVESEP